MFRFCIRDLPLTEFGRSDLDWPERTLRPTNDLTAHFTDLDCFEATAVLLAAPRNHIFASLPESGLSDLRGRGSQGQRGAWLDWLGNRMGGAEAHRLFSAELRKAKVKPALIRYGALPFVGMNQHVYDEGFNPRLAPLWRGWFRTYLIPRGERFRAALSEILNTLILERGEFAVRRCSDERVTPQDQIVEIDYTDDREDALLWWFYHRMDERPAFATQHKAIERLRHAVQRQEAGDLLQWQDASPALIDGYTRIVLADCQPQDIAVLNMELISSLRVRLMRMTGWPIFADILRGTAAAVERRNALFDPRRDKLPFDIAEEASACVTAILERYPSYRHEPLDALFEAC